MGYCTVQDVRDQGLTDTSAYPDATVQAAIDLASQYIDRATRQWFDVRARTVTIYGNDSDRLFLPVPIVSVTDLFINGRFDAADKLAAEDYTVFNGRDLPDDRKNPKIQLVNQRRSIFQVPALQYGRRIFMKGMRQKIVGTFGYVEADDSTPLLIKRACLKMTLRFVEKLAPSGTGSSGGNNSGIIIGESTDGHFIQYAMPNATGAKGGSYGVSKDPEVETILLQYRAPLGIAVPGSAYFELG